jgi:protein gp37
MIFVNSMSDLFHELVPIEFVADVFERMADASQHTYQVLTKRPERARDLLRELYPTDADPLAHVWIGVSIENSRYTWRANVLREIPAAVRFVSAEPLLGSLYETRPPARGEHGHKPLDLTSIDWLIAGGESGPNYRPADVRWLRELRDACLSAGVAFFFKQWGGRTAKAGGRQLDGKTFSEMPRVAIG